MAKKIPVSDASRPLAVNPFASLDLGPLPSGPEVPQSSVETPSSKAFRGRIVLRREKARRGGKTVVVAADFPPEVTVQDLEGLARRAKRACGCGGTVAEREIELQGDDPARARKFFEEAGFRVAGV